MRTGLVSRMAVVVAILLLGVPVVQAGRGGGGSPGNPGFTVVPMECRAMTGDDLGIGVTATDGYGTLQLRVGSGRLLCTVVVGDITPLPGEPPLNDVTGANALRCYSVSAIGAGQKVIAGADPGVVDDVFVSDEAVAIGNPNYLCVPAVVTEP